MVALIVDGGRWGAAALCTTALPWLRGKAVTVRGAGRGGGGVAALTTLIAGAGRGVAALASRVGSAVGGVPDLGGGATHGGALVAHHEGEGALLDAPLAVVAYEGEVLGGNGEGDGLLFAGL